MENKKKIIMMSALLLVLFVVVIGITYAAYTYTGNSNLNTIDLGRISMSYTEPSNAYVLDNALPMTDEEGKGQNNYFEFTVTSHATTKESDSTGITIPYEINISDIAIDEGMLELSKSLMKVNLVKVDGMTESEVVVPTLMSNLSSSSLNTGASVVYQANDTHKNGSTTITSKYRLRAWITTGFDVSDTDDTYQYKFRVNVNSNMDSLKPNVTEPTKLLRTAIMDQGVVNSGNGLYVSTQTNDGTPTYYYHGNVENNYVQFGTKELGNCTYNGNLLVDPYAGVYADKNACAQATGVCDARTIDMGKTYVIGVDEGTCTYYGATYIEVKPQWNDQVCYYKGEMVVKYTGNGTDLVAGNVPENECRAITELCDGRADGYGYVAGINEQFCNIAAPNGEYITVDEAPTFGKTTTPLLWRVIRINEDGTIKMILNDLLSDAQFNPTSNSYEYMYYSASNVEGGIKKTVDDWYASTLETDYDDYIATTNFCEAAKVKYKSDYTSGNATMEAATNYTANFKCEEDGNGKQYVSAKAGLITVDEVVMAGIPLNTGSHTNNTNTYLQKDSDWLTMSPAGFFGDIAYAWYVGGYASSYYVYNGTDAVRPVISLNADTLVTGSGASGDMWIVQK